MTPQKSKVNMPGVAPGKALAGIPVGDESAEERVLALLEGSVAGDADQVSGLFSLFQIKRHCILLFKIVHFLPQDPPRPEREARKLRHSEFLYPFFTHRSQSIPNVFSHRLPSFTCSHFLLSNNTPGLVNSPPRLPQFRLRHCFPCRPHRIPLHRPPLALQPPRKPPWRVHRHDLRHLHDYRARSNR